MPTYRQYLEHTYGIDGHGAVTGFLGRWNGQLWLGDLVNVHGLVKT
jgi:hypothetical protein